MFARIGNNNSIQETTDGPCSVPFPLKFANSVVGHMTIMSVHLARHRWLLYMRLGVRYYEQL